MGLPRLSIIVVSRHRRELLELCLAALSQQDHPEFELILVADPASLNIRPDLHIKRIGFDQANVGAARNLGLAAAAAEIVAFVDDDALALPSWASYLAAGFTDPQVVAAAGFTRGPDGLRWQVRAERITPSGVTVPLQVAAPVALPVEHGCPVSTIGTNCAFRRDALLQIGGFDPAFPYYLDESDVNMRLAAHQPDGLTAVLPGAEVIHGIAVGPMRGRAGVPHDLTTLGCSVVIFSRRHGGDPPPVEAEQRRRLVRHMVTGRLDPLVLLRLMRSLRRGMAEAAADPLPPCPPAVAAQPSDFLPLRSEPLIRKGEPVVLCGWHWQAGVLRRRAAEAVRAGQVACLLLLTPTILPHRLTLSSGGWWEQCGGLWALSGPVADDGGLIRAREQGQGQALFRRSHAESLFARAVRCRFGPFTKT